MVTVLADPGAAGGSPSPPASRRRDFTSGAAAGPSPFATGTDAPRTNGIETAISSFFIQAPPFSQKFQFRPTMALIPGIG